MLRQDRAYLMYKLELKINNHYTLFVSVCVCLWVVIVKIEKI